MRAVVAPSRSPRASLDAPGHRHAGGSRTLCAASPTSVIRGRAVGARRQWSEHLERSQVVVGGEAFFFGAARAGCGGRAGGRGLLWGGVPATPAHATPKKASPPGPTSRGVEGSAMRAVVAPSRSPRASSTRLGTGRLVSPRTLLRRLADKRDSRSRRRRSAAVVGAPRTQPGRGRGRGLLFWGGMGGCGWHAAPKKKASPPTTTDHELTPRSSLGSPLLWVDNRLSAVSPRHDCRRERSVPRTKAPRTGAMLARHPKEGLAHRPDVARR